jgi:hypothetical protein
MLQRQQVAPGGGAGQAAALSDFAGRQTVVVGVEAADHVQAFFQTGDPVAPLQKVLIRHGGDRFLDCRATLAMTKQVYADSLGKNT